jgi:hypothetical protein
MLAEAPCRRTAICAAIGAIASGVLTAAAGGAIDVHDRVFDALIVCWTCTPYLGASVFCRVILPTKWAGAWACGVLAYALVDFVVRRQALYAPSGSTDALVLIFLPMWSPLVIGVVTALVVVVSWLAAKSARGSV